MSGSRVNTDIKVSIPGIYLVVVFTYFLPTLLLISSYSVRFFLVHNIMEWSAEDEIQLLFAIDGLKPIGINKHFNMFFIAERLSRSLHRDIATESIWTHLRTLYNLDILDEMEPLPFPNDVKDFSLPELEFATLLSKKRAESEEKHSDSGSSTDAIKDKPTPKSVSNQSFRDIEKKVTAKLQADMPKRSQKRTRGSMSLESSSPSTTPPPLHVLKRRRI